MARKNVKTVYERIDIVQSKITNLEKELKSLKTQLISLNKEKDSYEMQQMFQFAKDNNLQLDEVINAINLFSLKQKVQN